MKLPALDRMRDNILRVYYDATDAERQEGMDWYDRAAQLVEKLATDTDVTINQAAAVVSILSPLVRWERNIEDARILIDAWNAGIGPDGFKVSSFAQNRRKAWWMLEEKSEPSTMFGRRAPKTGRFHELLIDPWITDRVVIDGHAFSIAVGVRHPLASPDIPNLEYKGRYERLEQAYREAAARVGIAPHQMQAVTWTVWRNRHGG